MAGGEHITATAAFTLDLAPEVDVCVIGEGEETIVDLAECGGEPKAAFDAIPGLLIRASGATQINRTPNAHPHPRRHPVAGVGPVPLDNYLDHGLGYGATLGAACRSWPPAAVRTSAPSARAR